MNVKDFAEFLLSKTDKKGYLSEEELISVALELGFSTAYFNTNLSFLRKMNILSKKIKVEGREFYFFNQVQYEKLIGKKKEEKGVKA